MADQERKVTDAAVNPETAPGNKFIVIGIWTISHGEESLFFWEDSNSYDHDPYLLAAVGEGSNTDIARETVIENLASEGIDSQKAERSIQRVRETGVVMVHTWGVNPLVAKRRRCPMVFVRVKPSILSEIEKNSQHLLISRDQLRPDLKIKPIRFGNSEERSVKRAFLRLVNSSRPSRSHAQEALGRSFA